MSLSRVCVFVCAIAETPLLGGLETTALQVIPLLVPLLVEEHITNITMPLNIFKLFPLQIFFVGVSGQVTPNT